MANQPAPAGKALCPATVAHDLNNLLSTILGHAARIQESVESGGEVYASATAIRRAVESCAALTAQLSAATPNAPPFQPVKVQRIVEEVMALIRPVTPPAISVEGRAGAEGAVVLGDPTLLLQMLLNLAMNARDAMGEEGALRLETAPADGGVRITVRDTGRGIPPEMRGLVFEPAVTTKLDGSGMGLAIVKHVAARHGGSVELESEPGKGSAFHVWLPTTSQRG